MNRDQKIADAAKKLIDAPYSLGNKEEGWDCLSLLQVFYGELGVTLPDLPDGFTWKNYGTRWEQGEGREEFYAYLLQIGHEIDVNYALAGDLMLFDYKEFVAPGVYLGNDTVLCAYEKGVFAVPFSRFIKHHLIMVRRCLTF